MNNFPGLIVKSIFIVSIALLLGCDNRPKGSKSDWIILILPDLIQAITPCPATKTFRSGETFSLIVPNGGSGTSIIFAACSDNPWVFKVQPPPDGTILLELYSPPCKSSTEFKRSDIPGALLELNGDVGCVGGKNNALRFSGKGSSGSEFKLIFN